MAGGKGGDGQQPLIVKKINKGHAGAHGGAWKVAFADFATAMMAFFLLLWLLGGTSAEQKAAISKYFDDPGGTFVGEGGANASAIDLGEPKLPTQTDVPETITPGAVKSDVQENDAQDEEKLAKQLEKLEQEKLDALKEQMVQMVNSNMAFSDYKDQVIIDITPEGLRIQIVDKDKRPMFDSGSSQMQYYSIAILQNLGKLLAQVPNRMSITGHTDATPFGDREDYSNWELSADRANAARRALIKGGVKETQIARVEGFASSIAFDEAHPADPINRRIAIIVLKHKVDEALKSSALNKWGSAPPVDETSTTLPTASPEPAATTRP